MADLGDHQLVKPSNEVEKKWIMVQIQERKSKIARYQQDIEDIRQAKIVALEAQILLNKQELEKLEEDLRQFDNVVEVNQD